MDSEEWAGNQAEPWEAAGAVAAQQYPQKGPIRAHPTSSPSQNLQGGAASQVLHLFGSTCNGECVVRLRAATAY